MKLEEKIDKYLNEGLLQKLGDFINRLEGMPTDKEWKQIQNIIDKADTFEFLAKAYFMDKENSSSMINADIMEKARELYKEYKQKGKKLPSGIEDAMEDANKKGGDFGKLQRWFRKNYR